MPLVVAISFSPRSKLKEVCPGRLRQARFIARSVVCVFALSALSGQLAVIPDHQRMETLLCALFLSSFIITSVSSGLLRSVSIYMFSITPMGRAKNATGIKHDLSLDSVFFPFAV
jgi:hypothetical protein